MSGIDLRWDPGLGLCTFEGLPVAMMRVDTTLAGLMSRLQAMVGAERFALALKAEGRSSVDADWEVIAAAPTFEEGFGAIADAAAVAGWGRWQLLDLDPARRTARFRASDSWEGRYQRSLGVCWGSGMLAGKLAGYGSRLFGTDCWAEQTAFVARGDPADEFTVGPSPRTAEEEIERLPVAEQASGASTAAALEKLHREARLRDAAERAASEARAVLDQAVAERTAELNYQRNLLAAQFQASPDGMLVTTEDGRILSWNQRFREMWGISDETLGTGSDDRALEAAQAQLADSEGFLAKVRHLRAHPDEATRDEILLRDGRVFDCYSAPVRSDGGEHHGRVWVFRDVTEGWRAAAERRERVRFLESVIRVEQALQGGEDLPALLSRVLDVCLDVFGGDRAWLLCPCDPDAPTWRVPMERTRGGYPGALAMGIEIPMLPEARAVFRAARESDEPVAYDPASGRALPPEAARMFAIQSQLTLCVRPRIGPPWLFGMHQCSHPRVWSPDDRALFRHIGRRLADAVSSLLFLHDLTQSERRYRELVEGTSDLIVQLDAAGRFTFVNRLAEAVYGLPPGECLGLPALEFVHPDDRERARQAHAQWVRTGTTTAALEVRQVSRRGEVHDMLWTVNLRYDGGGRLVSTGAIGRDISERKQTERDRLEMERQVQHTQKLESLGVMAGGIAHDFNNLLMAILGNADLALLTLDPGAAGREYVAKVERVARRAAELTNQMLAYTGRGSFAVGRLGLNPLVREIVHLLETVISKKADLRFELAPDLPDVEADASQLRQVVMNLITNASEALGEASGVITVRTSARQVDAALLRGCLSGPDVCPGRFVALEVADTGVGMDEATRERIFDPFFTTKFTGRGLGMAAVLGILRGHRGAIRVESAPGRGTTVCALLPALAGEGSRTSELPPAIPGATRSAATVLLADDDPHVLEVGEAMLGQLGHRVLTASDGLAALEVFRAHEGEIDLVILDLTMPRLDGAEALRELRRRDPEVRVVLSTGYCENETADRFAGQGLRGFLKKPYHLAALREAVGRALED